MASMSGTLYTGMTNNLSRRVEEHKASKIDGFTKRYSCYKLVYYEYYQYSSDCIKREKQVKKWRREKKEALINSVNPHWNDLYKEIM